MLKPNIELDAYLLFVTQRLSYA